MGLTWMGALIQAVLIVAAMSSLNSGLYSTGRVLRSLGMSKQAPAFMLKMSSSGVPWAGIMMTSVVYVFGAVLNAIAPDAFEIALESASIAIVFTWGTIFICQLRLRSLVNLGVIPRSPFQTRPPLHQHHRPVMGRRERREAQRRAFRLGDQHPRLDATGRADPIGPLPQHRDSRRARAPTTGLLAGTVFAGAGGVMPEGDPQGRSSPMFTVFSTRTTPRSARHRSCVKHSGCWTSTARRSCTKLTVGTSWAILGIPDSPLVKLKLDGVHKGVHQLFTAGWLVGRNTRLPIGGRRENRSYVPGEFWPISHHPDLRDVPQRRGVRI
jgi:hypothetical protein